MALTRIIIHAGMHKTGSKSIQNTFAALNSPLVQYGVGNSNNLSWAARAMFTSDEHIEKKFERVSQGQTTDELLDQKTKWLKLNADLINRSKKPNYLFSAELLSAPARAENRQNALHTNAHAYFDQFGYPVQVNCYVRPPLSFMKSAFQQNLKANGFKKFKLDGLWPRYRDRFKSMDRAFRRKNVLLRPYERNLLKNGDVVEDFADWIDVPLENYEFKSDNETMSLQAAALLYVHRRWGSGYLKGFSYASRLNMAFINEIRKITGDRFDLAPSLLLPYVDKFRSDIEWIEQRLGHRFEEDMLTNSNQISSEADLVDTALKASSRLSNIEGEDASDMHSKTVEDLAERMNRIQARVHEEERPGLLLENALVARRGFRNRARQMKSIIRRVKK